MSKSKRAWTRITPDANGSPRYVINHTALLTDAEKARPAIFGSPYPLAIKRAMTIGGRRYSQKGYPRGIVFSTHDLPAVEHAIMQALMDADQPAVQVETLKPPVEDLPGPATVARAGELLELMQATMEDIRQLLGR